MDICALPARTLRRLIGQKAVSPVELAEACLKRMDAIDKTLNAVVARDDEATLAAARVAEAAVMAGQPLGPLHGLPAVIKDLHPTRGLRTTWGSLLYKDHVPTADDSLVAAVRAAGAVIAGKSNTPEFGAGANTRNLVYGATGNPFDPALSASGSSGGSAVALATGMVPVATGSDTGGSLRTPASFCGVTGFRPSPGLVPSESRSLGWTPLSVWGPMGRDAEDTALLLSAIARFDRSDPFSWPEIDGASFYPLPEVDPASLSVAVSVDFGFAPVAGVIRACFEQKLERLAPVFGRVTRTDPPMQGADRAFAVMRAVSFLANLRQPVETQRALLDRNVIENVEEGLRYTAADVAEAHTLQTRIYRAMQRFFEPFDLLIAPMAAVPPFEKTAIAVYEIDGRTLDSYFHWLGLAYGPTLTGHPVACIPLGLGPTGMPFGLQLVGRRGADRFVLAAAAALERLFAGDGELGRPLPDLTSLSAPA
ncbi:MAG: amidase family protein [Alphaproteobacteria bacterium]|nr:amidase family protein [Alphaproteobacteria bacterium]